MNNKTVIRKKQTKGGFTTVHMSILNDKRLTPLAFRLLVSILSDSDTSFKLSQTLYKKRLGITENRTWLSTISNLEECGYLKRTDTKIRNYKHYTISEFGNLKSEKTTTELDESPKLNTIKIEDFADELQIEIDKRANKINVDGIVDYLMNLINNGELNNLSQLNNQFYNKIIDYFIIVDTDFENNELTATMVKELCEKRRNKVHKSKYNEFVNACLESYNYKKNKGDDLSRFSGIILGISNQNKFKIKRKN